MLILLYGKCHKFHIQDEQQALYYKSPSFPFTASTRLLVFACRGSCTKLLTVLSGCTECTTINHESRVSCHQASPLRAPAGRRAWVQRLTMRHCPPPGLQPGPEDQAPGDPGPRDWSPFRPGPPGLVTVQTWIPRTGHRFRPGSPGLVTVQTQAPRTGHRSDPGPPDWGPGSER